VDEPGESDGVLVVPGMGRDSANGAGCFPGEPHKLSAPCAGTATADGIPAMRALLEPPCRSRYIDPQTRV
jgi:hypothetical protein